MAVIDRDHVPLPTDELTELAALDDAALLEAAPAATEPVTWSMPARVLLAALLAGAGTIHLVMVPSHAAQWLPEGVAFAAAGWMQLGLAVVLIARPSRGALRATASATVVFIAAWAVSRIWGWPVGPEAGAAHAASFIDVTCVALEAATVVVACAVLARPSIGSRVSHGAQVMLSVIPLGVLALATAAIASPSAVNHAHGGGAADDHNHASVQTTGATGTGGATTDAADGHDHDHAAGAPAVPGAPGAPVDDKGLSLLMNGQGEGGGHTHNNAVVPMDAATQAQLDAQLAQTRLLIDKYPTVKDAEAAGYHRQGPYSPGLGAHYGAPGAAGVNLSTTVTDESLAHPTLIYDGIEPGSKLAGFMYMIFSMDTEHAPEGFAGPNDHWHYHTNVCIAMRPDGGIDAPLGADTSATQELCDKYHGRLIANTGYMVHVWTVPDYESPQGVFSNVNAKLTCPNGTYYVVTPDEIGTRTNACKDVPA